MGTVFLPHDSRQKQKSSGMSTLDTYRGLGFTCEVVPMVGIMDGINAVRDIFHKCWFDQEACKEGLNALRNYHEKKDPITGRSAGADHDRWSHGADGFRYFAVACSHELTQSKGDAALINGMKAIRGEAPKTITVNGHDLFVITQNKRKNSLTKKLTSF